MTSSLLLDRQHKHLFRLYRSRRVFQEPIERSFINALEM
jgi:hypothetical protein